MEIPLDKFKDPALEKRKQRTSVLNQMQIETERQEEEKALRKDKLKNPHLALISNHLWWLALFAKISIGMLILSIIGAILLGS